MKIILTVSIALMTSLWLVPSYSNDNLKCTNKIIKQSKYQWISHEGKYEVVSKPLIRTDGPINIGRNFESAIIGGSSVKCTYKKGGYWIDTYREFQNKAFAFVPAKNSKNWKQVGPSKYVCTADNLNDCQFTTQKTGRET